MKKHPTTYDLDKSKLSRLLKMGLQKQQKAPKATDPQQDACGLWQRLMAHPLPLDEAKEDILPGVLADLCQTMGLLAGETVQSLLLNPRTDLDSIRLIKAYAKTRSQQSQTEAEPFHEADSISQIN